ncbi:MAG: CobW family GTP-binding protein [Paracoccaceae bacterium]
MLPVTAIGGYLGAGKTTLVNHLLRHANGQRLAVLVNEFGALPIDEDLIEAQDDTLISIAGGCVCCSYGNDLIEAMIALSHMNPMPDHILIEASGVALPGAIAATVGVLDGFQVDGIVVMTDAETIQAQAQNPYIGDTITRQLAEANLVLLNKADLVSKDKIRTIEAWLGTVAPQAAIVRACHGAVPHAVVLQGFGPDLAALDSSGHTDIGAFSSAVLHVPGVVDADTVARTLADPAHGLVRAKGFVPTSAGLRAIQVVGRRWAVSDAPAGAASGLVVIAARADLDPEAIERAIRPVGEPAPPSAAVAAPTD